MIEAEPSFGYRTVASLLGFNKNTVQRLFQLFGWQVKKRPIGFCPRVQALPSVAQGPNQRWATDLCRIWAGRDGWLVLALVIDCYTRELLGWHLSRSGKAKTAESALEQALIARYGSLGKVEMPFLLRSDNGLVFTSRSYTALVRSYGLQTFETMSMSALFFQSANDAFDHAILLWAMRCNELLLQHASRVIGDWISFYNNQRPHQSLAMKTPAMTYALAA